MGDAGRPDGPRVASSQAAEPATGAPTRAPAGGPGIALRFAAAARQLGQAARLRELEVPGYRSPPGLDGVQRSIRRNPRGATVAVRLRGRPWGAVLSDMIEGIIVANGLEGARADRVRAALWLAVEPDEQAAA